MSRLRAGRLLIAVLCAAPLPAAAGPHANVMLLAHLAPQIEYTSTTSTYAGESDLDDCRQAIVEGPVPGEEKALVWFVIASFMRSPGPVNVGGVEFGFGSYRSSDVSFVGLGPCQNWIEVPTEGWPGPRQGIALALMATGVGVDDDPLEVYWFATYVYNPVTIELTPSPATGFAGVASEEVPPIQDEALDLGKLGFGQGQEGYNPCAPGVEPTGACCAFGDCRLVSETECQGLGGSFHGAGTTCFPTPCGVPIETTWGLLKKIYD